MVCGEKRMPELGAETELLLTRYLDGELGKESRAQFEKQLSSDTGLREELEERKRLRLQLRGAVKSLTVPDLLTERVQQFTLRRRTLLRTPAAWRSCK